MAKQRKVLPARRDNATDDSLLIRSAESLGRMIGTLQRQLDAARQLTGRAAVDGRRDGRGADTRGSTTKRKAAKTTRAVNAKTKSAAPKRAGAGRRTTKAVRGA